mmetsp:Transcript_21557/g.73111  ORF Transcript_21557/g.73111 Transcript_21557/m.73111 type:complete len:285 (+) Transcript_21557:181-1035(+)
MAKAKTNKTRNAMTKLAAETAKRTAAIATKYGPGASPKLLGGGADAETSFKNPDIKSAFPSRTWASLAGVVATTEAPARRRASFAPSNKDARSPTLPPVRSNLQSVLNENPASYINSASGAQPKSSSTMARSCMPSMEPSPSDEMGTSEEMDAGSIFNIFDTVTFSASTTSSSDKAFKKAALTSRSSKVISLMHAIAPVASVVSLKVTPSSINAYTTLPFKDPSKRPWAHLDREILPDVVFGTLRGCSTVTAASSTPCTEATARRTLSTIDFKTAVPPAHSQTS